MSDLTILPVDTASLGDRSYLVHDGEVAFVVDPQRDIDRVQHLLEQEGVRLTHVLETHIHNDYVTGGHALARATGAAYLVNAADPVSFDRVPVEDRQVVAVGDRMRLTAVATPGHTWTHLSYLLTDEQQTLARAVRGLAAARVHRPPRPPRPRPHRRARAPPARLGPPARRPRARQRPAAADARVRLVLLRDPVRRDGLHDRRRAPGQPGAPRGRRDLGGRPAGRPRRLARLLRPHGPGQPRRARRPRPHSPAPRGRRRDPAGAARRRVGGRPAAPHRVRGRPRAGLAELRARGLLRHLPGLADPRRAPR